MNTHDDKTQAGTSRSVANEVSQKQKNSEPSFVDNRPGAIAQRKLQAMTGNPALQLSAVIQRQISDADYNRARTTLVNAGSNSAAASHVKHTGGRGSPDGHGVALVNGAIAEFRATDAAAPARTRGMTMAHFVAVSNAAHEMGLDIEDIL
jgi:hypothetical protein